MKILSAFLVVALGTAVAAGARNNSDSLDDLRSAAESMPVPVINEGTAVPAPVIGSVAGCYAPSSGAKITDGVRADCVRGSRVLLDYQPEIRSAEDIRRANIAQVRGFDMEETVHCAFTPPPPSVWANSGMSEKFSCYRTDGSSANRGIGYFYNSRGELVPEAVSTGEYGTPQWGMLLDGTGRTLGKPEKLKVKYYLGDKRMREPFSETASGRLFWALGIPTDHTFAVRKVVCHGCNANPFRDKQMKPAGGTRTFLWTSIERGFEGETVEYKEDQNGWDWNDLKEAAVSSGRGEHYETLLLASRLVSMTRPKPLQNKIICVHPDPRTGLCGEVYSIVHDLGSTFGKPNLLPVGQSPRADLNAYAGQRVFNGGKGCGLNGDYGNYRISESGRRFFAQRLLSAFGEPSRPGAIDRERVKMLFRAAHFEGIDLDPADSGELNAWTDQLVSRMSEVLTTDCGSSERKRR